MRLLAIDTATPLCGVAILCSDDKFSGGAEKIALRRERSTTHSERLLQLIADCLAELAMVPADLDAVACGAGPGSFTGLRIGLATAKGLCFALGRPLVMVSSLEALAVRGAGSGRYVLATLDAFRNQIFARLLVSPAGVNPDEPVLIRHPRLLEDAAWQPEELAAAVAPLGSQLVLCGGGCRRYPAVCVPQSRILDDDDAPHPLDLARLAMARLAAGQVADLGSSVPNYVCASAPEAAAAEAAAAAAKVA